MEIIIIVNLTNTMNFEYGQYQSISYILSSLDINFVLNTLHSLYEPAFAAFATSVQISTRHSISNKALDDEARKHMTGNVQESFEPQPLRY